MLKKLNKPFQNIHLDTLKSNSKDIVAGFFTIKTIVLEMDFIQAAKNLLDY